MKASRVIASVVPGANLLLTSVPVLRAARGVLVFLAMVKADFLVGGQHGDESAGMVKTLTSTTLREGVYAFVFGQKGLMAGIGLQGTKVTQIHPD